MRRLVGLLAIAALAGLASTGLAASWAGGQDDQAGETSPAEAPGPAWAAQGDWAELLPDAGGSLWFVDRAGSDFTAWPLRVIARAHHPGAQGRFSWTQREMEIDCDRHRYRFLRTIRQDRAGRTSEAAERGGGGFRSTEPESGPEWVTRFVCQGPGSLPGHVWPPEMVRNTM